MDLASPQMSQLKAFGLPVHAARAYLALLQLGVAEARGVSELANIPTAKVYATLAQLQKRGLAQVTPGKPRKYAAVPMREFLERTLRDQEEQAQDLRARADAISALFPVVGTAVLPDRPQTVMLSGKRNILQRFREASAAAQERILAIATPELARADGPLRRQLDQAKARGVDVSVLADASDANPDRPADASACRGVVLATFDKRAAMLMRLGSPRPRDRGAQETALHTSEPGFVRPLRRLIEMQSAAGRDAAAAARAGPQTEPGTFAQRVAQRPATRAR